jgi:hypothetical protein
MFLRLILVLVFIHVISAIRDIEQETMSNRERTVIAAFNRFCLGKQKVDFCSDQNLESMLHVLKNQREENVRKADEFRKQQLQHMASNTKQNKLERFFAENPKYKIMSEFGTLRFY